MPQRGAVAASSRLLSNRTLLAGVTLLSAAWLANLPCCGNNLIGLDDFTYLTALPEFSWRELLRLFTEPREGYQPLALLTLAMDYRLWGADPFPYHLVSLLLHGLNTLLVYAFVMCCLQDQWTAWATALLFAVHPIHVEPIAWVASRKDLLFAAFYLASLLAYVRWLDRRSHAAYGLAIASIIIAFLAKGMAASIALSLPALDWLRRRNMRSLSAWLDKGPFVLVSLAFGLVSIYAQQASGYSPTPDRWGPPLARILVAGCAGARYLQLLFLPIGLSAYHPWPETAWSLLLCGALGTACALSLILAALFSPPRWRPAGFGVLFLFANLVLFLQIVPVANFLVAERYAYVGSIGVCLLVAWGLRQALSGTAGRRALAHAVLVSCAVLLGALSARRCAVWKDGLTLWTDAIRRYPRAVFAWDQRALEHYALGHYREAIANLDQALRLNPTYLRAFINRAAARYRVGDFHGAIVDYDEVIRRSHGPDGYSGRGLARAELGDMPGALEDLNRAVEIGRGKEPLPYLNRARVRLRVGDWPGAAEDARRGLVLRPEHPTGWLTLGLALEKLGRTAEARQALAQALRLDPTSTEARTALTRLQNPVSLP